MKHYSIRTTIAIQYAFVVLIVVFLISIVSNFLISRQFENYVEEQQNEKAEDMALNLSHQYDAMSGGWNLDYVHGLGMYALNEGYILKLSDEKQDILWDAQNHDMTLCSQMMGSISSQMQENYLGFEGKFVTHRYDLKQGNQVVGYLDVSYYSPYYLNENEFHFIEALNQILIVVGICSLLMAVVIGLFLAGSLSKPIAKIVEITERISDGDYSIRFQEGVKTKELDDLSRAVNYMAESLENQETIRKRLTSDVAHELRTPLANVSSYLEAIIEGVWEPTPERLQNCYDELERISKLVSDLERLKQMENENLKLHKTRENLLELVQAVMKNFEIQMESKNLRSVVTGEDVFACIDRNRMQQVITNLISNAVKYSNENGTIRVKIEKNADMASIQVQDEGIGIPEKDLPLIFERFYRTDKSRNRRTGGAGIGLTIAKAIVQAHGGKIIAESKQGIGSTFTVIFPVE